MLRRETVVGGGILLAALVVIAATAWLSHGNQGVQSPVQSRPATTNVSPACRLFTLADATAVLGAGTKDTSHGGEADATSQDATITVCRYTLAINQPDENGKTVLVLVRQANTPAGANYNRSMFGFAKPQGMQTVADVGDAAFWDAHLSELSVLKGDTWYIIGNMDGPDADSGTLDTSLAVYRQIKPKL